MNYLSPLKSLARTSQFQSENLRRRATVLIALLVSTIVILILAFFSVVLSFATDATPVHVLRLIAIAAVLLFAWGLYISLRRGRYVVAAYGVIGIYAALATVMAFQWGINLQAVSLLYCIVIVISGMVLGARHSLYAALACAALMFGIQLAVVHHVISPNTTWSNSPPQMLNVAIYFLVFAVLSVSSWLFNRQTDSALMRALRAEQMLEKEKENLKLELEVRTRALENAQAEKIGQLYRFAQLGQFTTSLLHDLANHMSTLSIDIEGMAEQNRHTQLERRIKQRITHIDDMVHWAYEHLNGEVVIKDFNAKQEIQEVIKRHQYTARQAHVQLVCTVNTKEQLQLRGDPNRFRQIMTNLIMNAIDAYKTMPDREVRTVEIELERSSKQSLAISVSDHGIGIPKNRQDKVFQPFYSTKPTGMGIGLFVVKQLAEEYFRGTVSVSSDTNGTRFTLKLMGTEHAK
jgi:signal transduction histidine kinase